MIALFAAPGALAADFATHVLSFGDGALYGVTSLTVQPDGSRLVLNTTGQIRVYDQNGQLLNRVYEIPRCHPFYDSQVSLAYAADGDVYILDHCMLRLARVDESGTLLDEIGGSEGSDPGQFSMPDDLVLAPDGSLYVADFGNNRVQHLSRELTFLDEWATPPPPAGERGVAGPDALAVDADGRVWVGWAHYTSLDGRVVSARILIYEPGGMLVGEFPVDPGESADSGWLFRYLAVDSAAHLRVFFDRSGVEYPALLEFDATGQQVVSMVLPQRTEQLALAADDSVVVAGQSDIGTFIEMLNPAGEVVTHWGDAEWAAEHNMMTLPRQVAFDPQDGILVAGGRDARYLHRYHISGELEEILYSADETGEWLFAVAPDGTAVRSPDSIAIDADGNRYYLIDVEDDPEDRVLRTDSSGNPLAEWNVGRSATKIAIGLDGLLYVDRRIGWGGYGYGLKIDRYDLDGQLLGSVSWFGGGDFHAVDPGGRLYFSRKEYWETPFLTMVERYTPDGRFLDSISHAGSELLGWIFSLAVREDGTLVVTDFERSRAHVLELTPSRFSDISLWYWAMDHIEAVAEAGFATGFPDGTYRPTLPVDRAQMAVYLARALAGDDASVPDAAGPPSFSDVPADHWAHKYIEYVKAHGLVQGFTDGSYHPEKAVDRAQMAVFLARALAGSDEDIPRTPWPPTFEDVPPVRRWWWCYRHVEYLHEQDVINGYPDGLYHPGKTVTRDQMAVYLQRAFDFPP